MVLKRERAAHMHGVAEYMYRHARQYGLDPDQMFLLGYIHDIGHITQDKDAAEAGAKLLAEAGYKDAYTVLRHKKILTPNDAQSLKLQLLIEADMHIGMNGEDIGFDERLDQIAKAYGKDSPEYELYEGNIQFLRIASR